MSNYISTNRDLQCIGGRPFVILFFMCFVSFNSVFGSAIVMDTLPTVFILGEKEAEYEKLVEECNKALFAISDNSMDKAYESWLGMLHDIEVFAEKDTFDIKGVKIWFNTFWNGDGTIRHISYYPKPNSKNIDYDEMTLFLNRFTSFYKFEESFESCFSHYGSATFPTHASYYLNK